MKERIFLLHPGVEGFVERHWELMAPGPSADPFAARVARGEVPEARVFLAVPPLPPGWAPGRYFALFPLPEPEPGPGRSFDWKEVTAQVEIDRERGLDRVPGHLRERYRKETIAMPMMHRGKCTCPCHDFPYGAGACDSCSSLHALQDEREKRSAENASLNLEVRELRAALQVVADLLKVDVRSLIEDGRAALRESDDRTAQPPVEMIRCPDCKVSYEPKDGHRCQRFQAR